MVLPWLSYLHNPVQVISKLAGGAERKGVHVPFRQSKSGAQKGSAQMRRWGDEAGLEAETRMGINGMTFELSDEAVEATKQNYPKLPGVNGPNPHLSSGSRKIKGTFQMTFKAC